MCNIDNYHFLLPGTIKQIKLKVSKDVPSANNDVTLKLDDRSKQYKIGMPIFK